MTKLADILKIRGITPGTDKKLHNRTTRVDGIDFDSQREANRYIELKMLERAGKITDLKLQVMYELIPAIYENIPTGEIYVSGKKKGQPKTKRVCIEKAVKYIADFQYIKDGEIIVEDSKGFRKTDSATYKVFVLKRKLMLWRFGIRVREV
jgi:hypothetical protein